MSYESAPATILLATHCCSCGRPLVDATSVQLGIGPECRSGFDGGISDAVRTECNRLTYEAAVAAQEGKIERVRELAEAIRALGLDGLADKVATRFQNAEKLAKITIEEVDGMLRVDTPYKRSMGQEFVSAWRAIPGRKWSNGRNAVPVTSKRHLWELLQKFFPGEFGKGPKGTFRIPKADKAGA